MKKKLILLFTMLPFVLFISGCLEIEPSFKIVDSIDTVEIYSDYADAGAQYKYGTIKETVFSQDTFDTSVLGLYELNYEYLADDQTYSAIRYVIVVDQTQPIIELNPGIDTVSIGTTWTDQGVIVTDNSLDEVIPVISGTVNTQIAGTYEIVYTATDSSGNVNSITRFVTVVEPT